MNPNDGGAAFPHKHLIDTRGMSLRDYFAWRALTAILSNGELVVALRQKYGSGVTPHIADTAYEFADAMLEAREEGR